jgi:hypothetical protein
MPIVIITAFGIRASCGGPANGVPVITTFAMATPKRWSGTSCRESLLRSS